MNHVRHGYYSIYTINDANFRELRGARSLSQKWQISQRPKLRISATVVVTLPTPTFIPFSPLPDLAAIGLTTPNEAVHVSRRGGRYCGSKIKEDQLMARTATKRGKDETKVAEKKVEKTGKPVGGARGGITAPVTPSPELSEIVGDKDLPRSEVVSKVWEYIKKHDLQDAKDRRQINADDKLEKVFGKKSASMFEMNKHLSRHLTAKR